MNSKKIFWLMLGVLTIFSLVSIASIFWGDKTLRQRSAKLVALKLDSRVLDEQQIALSQATKDIQKYKDLGIIARNVVPQDKDQAEAVREIVKIAGDSNVKLAAISFPASTLGQAAPKTNPSDNTTPKTVTPPLTQVKAVDNIPGVYVMEINVQQDATSPVTYDRLINFLSRLEQNRRTAQVISVTVQPNTQNRSLLTFSLVLNIYIKP